MGTQAFCLKRSNHLNDMVDDLERMLKDENMVDVTLSCEDGLIKAHKIILSASSSYFRQILSKGLNNSLQYPIIIIKDMSFQDLKAIIDFIYRGEVTVPQEQLNSVLKSAEFLKVKGLADVTGQKGVNLTTTSSTISKNTTLIDDSTRRKKKKKKRKTSSQADKDKSSLNSSENLTEYSDEEDILAQHHLNLNSQTNQSQNELNQDNILQASAHHSSSSISALNINENEIEPSRLLEQTMITGDAPNIPNIQSLTQANNQNKYSQYLMSNVKQMMYDDSSGLMTGQLANTEQSSNQNLAQFDESNTLASSSSISLLPRQEHFSSNTSSSNHNQQNIPLVPSNSNATQSQSSPLNNQNALSTSLLPMQIHQSLNNISNISTLPVAAASRSQLSLNIDNLAPKRLYSCPVCYKTFSEKGLSPTLTSNASFISEQLLNTSSQNTLNSINALSQMDATAQQSSNNFSGGEEVILNQDGTNKPTRSYQCNLCLKRFDIRYSLQRHLKVIHDPSRHLFQCQACNKEFAWKSAYLRHINHTCARQKK